MSSNQTPKFRGFKAFFALFALPLFSALFISTANAASAESEHPPLSEDTKKAIAAYKRAPSEANKAALKAALTQSYERVIAQKQEKLAQREAQREQNINAWLKAVKSGKNPPFMSLETSNKKDDEREAVAAAISAYRANANAQSEAAVKSALQGYYDAFLKEQKAHIKETITLKNQRIEASLARFTSERFSISKNRANADTKDLLAEIIAAYLNAGAVFVPVNPEARVREREFNAKINAAQEAYLQDKSAANRDTLKTQIANAFEDAYAARLTEFEKAEKKGLGGAAALLKKMQDAQFLAAQQSELTQQRNLYGRIERRVSFEGDFGGIVPRLKDESNALYELLQSADKAAFERDFKKLYAQMLGVQRAHLNARKSQLTGFTEELLAELTRQNSNKRNRR